MKICHNTSKWHVPIDSVHSRSKCTSGRRLHLNGPGEWVPDLLHFFCIIPKAQDDISHISDDLGRGSQQAWKGVWDESQRSLLVFPLGPLAIYVSNTPSSNLETFWDSKPLIIWSECDACSLKNPGAACWRETEPGKEAWRSWLLRKPLDLAAKWLKKLHTHVKCSSRSQDDSFEHMFIESVLCPCQVCFPSSHSQKTTCKGNV